MRGSLVKRNGVWHIRYDLPYGSNGRRHQVTKSCRGMNKAQAEEKLRSILKTIDEGQYIESSKMTLSEFLAKWIEVKRGSLSPKTTERYEQMIRLQIAPTLGDIQLSHLKPISIQNLYSKLCRHGGTKDKGLSAKTVRNIHGLLHGALSQAVKWQIIGRNPIDAVEPPTNIRPDIQILADPDLPKLLKLIEGARYRIPYLIILATGMRRGEALGLQWEDLDAGAKTLLVKRSIGLTGTTNVFVKGTKTGRSRRVAIPDFLVSVLLEHRKEQIKNGMLVEDYRNNGWICADLHGELLNPSNVGRAFARMARASGINISLHGLRHTQATKLIMSGIPVKVVSERLGHSTVAVTQDIYTHVTPNMQEKAADLIDDLLKNA